MKVGFIGLGLMGGAMAANLLKGGHSVCGYDISKAALDALVEKGGTVANSPAEAAADAEIVFTMLPLPAHVENAVMGPNGVGQTMKPGTLFVDCSTILPDVSLKVGKYLKEKGIHMLDAGVGRTSHYAVLGKLLSQVLSAAKYSAVRRTRKVFKSCRYKVVFSVFLFLCLFPCLVLV